ncbi:MAG: hypothetical protein COY81_00095 [Candidatus Pacebacteria bacterium CG_4_10_14_0_8_um_filter_43_12]|nr:MAG: hypothetical protein COY81_00095 [Candidatus Pacebacteria bacterium CG_4_10_14_0_8_um_filter_43_12]
MRIEHDNGMAAKQQQLVPTVYSVKQLFLKATGLSLLFALVLLLITGLIFGLVLSQKLSQFLTITGLSFSQAKSIVTKGITQDPKQTDGKTIILILGLDRVLNKQLAQPLTDTIILASIDYSSGTVRLLSLPRDLWSPEYQTKINALYAYGQDRYPNQPERFSSEVISQMTGAPIDYTVVFSLQSISQLVQMLGGLQVTVPTSFVDSEFPREDIDLSTAISQAELYQRVEFKQGTELLSPERVTQYIRSRHSQGETGTDLDRAARQQLVLSSLVRALLTKQVLFDPNQVAQLYLWYQATISPYIPITDLVSIAYALVPVSRSVVFSSQSLGIYPDLPAGTITHPPVKATDNQWTYTIRNQQLFEAEIYDKLGI